MTPIEFPEQTTVWAKTQPEYLSLPAFSNDVETVSKWKLTWGERLYIVFTGVLWLRQSNFGQPLQPQRPMVDSPFLPEGK